MKDLLIYGAGGLGKEIVGLVNSINSHRHTWKLLGFLDDDKHKKECFGYKVLGNETYLNNKSVAVVVAVGDPKIRKHIINKLPPNTHYPNLIHPAAILMDTKSIKIGKGCVIAAGCVLTCDIKLGDYVLINLNATVGHDAMLNDFASIMCGVNIAGTATLGKESFVGSGANILNGVAIGENTKIGAGAVVIQNVPDNVTAVGVPARIK